MALGSAGAYRPERSPIAFGEEALVEGMLRRCGLERIQEIMERGIRHHDRPGLGRGEDRVWTCDLSEEYVRLNSKYTYVAHITHAARLGGTANRSRLARRRENRRSVAALDDEGAARGRSALRPSDQVLNPKMQKYSSASATAFTSSIFRNTQKFRRWACFLVRWSRAPPARRDRSVRLRTS